MEKLKKIFRYALYMSLGFVVYYLFKFDYLVFGSLSIDYIYLALSILFLFSGFYVSSLSWRKALKVHNIKISHGLAVYSHGISVFAKYIPGKIWVVLGRASIVSEKDHSLMACSTISLKEQLVYLLIGLIISSVAFLFIDLPIWSLIFVFFTAISLGFFLFSQKIYTLSINILQKTLKKTLDIPFIGFKQALPFSYMILFYWSLWSLAFFFLSKSFLPVTSPLVAFAFPASVCYGLLAIVIPGGIGVREGIIVFILSAIGIDPIQATTLSVIQRMWFIMGEVFIFTMALIFRKTNK